MSHIVVMAIVVSDSPYRYKEIARKSYAPPEAITLGCSRSGKHCAAEWFVD
jgi:hypothetical protein